MDDVSTIDIEGKTLALSSKELYKLTTDEGCSLQVVTNKVLKMDNTDYDCESDSDEEKVDQFYVEDHDVAVNDDESIKKANEERMKREYITLILNANDDPIKPGSRFKSRDIFSSESVKRESTLERNDFDISNLEEKYLGIHRMFENIGKYDDYMKRNKFEELTPGQVYKLIRSHGIGQHAQIGEDSLVIYNCALWTEGAKEPFDSTWLRRTTSMVHLATDSILPGLRDLLLSAQQGELCEAFMRPEVAFGRLGAMPRIPPNATVFCLLQIVRVIPQDKIARLMRSTSSSEVASDSAGDGGIEHHHSLNFEDFYEASDEARRRGNYFYEREQYRIALQRYKSAIRILEGISYQSDKQESMGKELLVKLYNNCARTSNAMGNPRGALSACRQASLIDDKVPKTYWHRMSAWSKKGHLDRALGVARRAVKLFQDPSISRPFMKAAEELKYKLQQEQVETDQLHRLMARALIPAS